MQNLLKKKKKMIEKVLKNLLLLLHIYICITVTIYLSHRQPSYAQIRDKGHLLFDVCIKYLKPIDSLMLRDRLCSIVIIIKCQQAKSISNENSRRLNIDSFLLWLG